MGLFNMQPYKFFSVLVALLFFMHPLGGHAEAFRVNVGSPPNQTELLEFTSDGDLNLLALDQDGRPIGMVQENWGDDIEESALESEFIVYRGSDYVILARASASEGNLQLRGHLFQWTGEIPGVPGYPELAIESDDERVAMLDPHGNLWLLGQKDCGCQHEGNRLTGTIPGGVSLPDPGIGYYQFSSADAEDTDDWSCSCTVINAITNIGINWGRTPYIGISDLSKAPETAGGDAGGHWDDHPSSHANGLDVDVRYVRSDNQPSAIGDDNTMSNTYHYKYIFGSHPIDKFSRQGTIDLMELFFIEGAKKILVHRDAMISEADFPQYLRDRGIQVIRREHDHHDHFHVEFFETLPWPGY